MDSDSASGDKALEQGVVFVLPGIEGRGPISEGVIDGLRRSGVPYSLVTYEWGRPVPLLGPLLNQMDVLSNRAVAETLSQRIQEYHQAYPNGKIYLIGHSGGAGVAVFAAEVLPDGFQIDGVVLLSPSISAGYDTSAALAHSRNGIVNFWSSSDVALLMVGTTVAGNMDGVHGPAAGALGFSRSRTGLYQVPWEPQMRRSGNHGGHLDTAHAGFVADYVAPWVMSPSWPAGETQLSYR
jgi:pimeloyl-ACP methyl ester carboxylesterase